MYWRVGKLCSMPVQWCRGSRECAYAQPIWILLCKTEAISEKKEKKCKDVGDLRTKPSKSPFVHIIQPVCVSAKV